MAKIEVIQDSFSVPTTGRWTWKDEPPSLEFISNNPAADKQEKRRKAKGEHGKGRSDSLKPKADKLERRGRSKHEQGKEQSDRAASSTARSLAMARGHGQTLRTHKTHVSRKETADHPIVTLLDIKLVAHEMMSEVTPQLIPETFLNLFMTEQFDEFLLYLLSYFNCFFEKMNQENKKNPMYIEPSLSEKKAYADVCARIQVAQSLLGQYYCVLVLGLGLEDYHHMGCGKSRVSSTHKDKSMFEAFYTFCTFVVWITFRRKDFEVIRKEIGRMLRSDTFNPAIRVKFAPEVILPEIKDDHRRLLKPDEQKSTAVPEKKLTPAEYRRLHPRRPAIKAIINQRSPAVISILPSPKEEAQWLFKKNEPKPSSSNALTKALLDCNIKENEEMEDKIRRQLTIVPKKYKVGILGEPYNLFNSMTLTPVGTENEEEEAEGNSEEKEMGEESTGDKSLNTDRGMSRQQTGISTATTEAMSDDDVR